MCNALFVAMIVCFLWMPVAQGFDGELIAPTRTLKGENVKPGKLYVFSEPPGLKVILDGKTLGKAPIYLESVGQGAHQLRVADKETTLYVTAGEVRRLSYFKGRFVEVPVEGESTGKQPRTGETERTPKQSAEEKPEKAEQLEPGYFPLKPSGPIY